MNNRDDQAKERVSIANCSGFFGDRFSAAKEMVEGGPIDFLTGDYLAELTMAILFRLRLKSPEAGYVKTFLKQMEEIMGTCLDKKIRVVSNAGGLNPGGLAIELSKIAEKLGLHPKIAYIEGDDLMGRINELQTMGETFVHLDKGITLAEAKAQSISANAYMGCWGIVKALDEGADIVVGGRIADASVVVGPAAATFGWKRDDWDWLAGASVAGHIIECGCQATGGNYSFMEEVPSYRNVGFPIAEIRKDGSSTITKHPGTGGLVSIGTVKAQLLYEIRDARYLTPDVVARFDTIAISQEGDNRVCVSGVRGEAPPETTKVCINNLGDFRNSMTVVLTGLDIERKAQIFTDALFESIGGKDQYEALDVRLMRTEKEDPATNDEAFSYLRLTVIDRDQKRVAQFSNKIVELALSNIPGFTATAPPTAGSPTVVHWPALISQRHIRQKVVVGEKEFTVDFVSSDSGKPVPGASETAIPPAPGGKVVRTAFGRIFATRSGDKGGNANLGVWAKTPEAFAFLREYLTVEKLKALLKDVSPFEIERYEFPNLLAVNFYIKGILRDGAAGSILPDPQAKTLGEYLRAKMIEVPASII